MQTIEETKYIVVETDKVTNKTKPAKLVTGLEQFRKRYASQADLETFYDHAIQAGPMLWGLTVREATDEDISDHGGLPEIVALANLYSGAEARMKADKLTAARGLVEHLEEKVKTEDDLIQFLYIYGINTAQLMAIAKSVRDEDGVILSDGFVKIYTKLVADRSQSTTNKRTAAQVRKDWDKVAKASANGGASANT